MLPLNYSNKSAPSVSRALVGRFSLFSFFLLLLGLQGAAQCTTTIQNNSIALKPAVCANTVGYLEGTIPTGGSSTNYTYQWDSSSSCGNGTFVAIPGATGKDYAPPLPVLTSVCYRRVVTSGTGCTDASNKITLSASNWTSPAAPSTTVVQPTCSTPTGTITINSPAPSTGVTYSVNGSTYTNTTGIFTGLAPGTYPVTAKMPTGCVSPVKSVVVNALPVLSGTISPANSTICPGSSQLLTVSGNALSYQWSLGGVPIPGANASTFSASTPGTYTVVLITGACSTQASNTATVSLHPAPAGTISPSAPTICSGANILLKVTGNGTSYQWYLNGFGLAGQTADTFRATLAGTYTVDIITANNCKARIGSSVVTVTPLPTGSIAPPSLTLCAGDTGTLTAIGGASYQWYKDGLTLSGETGASLRVWQAGRYATDITEIGGCVGKSVNESVVTINALPAGPIVPANAVLCPGSNVTLSVSGGTAFRWYRDGIIVPGATGTNITVTEAGVYTADIFMGSCKGGATNAGIVTLGTIPTGSISPAAGTICQGNTVPLTAIGGTTYQWYLNGNPIAGATNANFSASQTGTYTVVLFKNGCSGPASNSVIISPSTAITFNPSVVNPSCASTTGSITVATPTGGSGNGYTYSKDNGATFQTSNAFTGLAAGTYQLVVKDALGCKSNPVAVIINAFISTLQASTSTTPITCTQTTGSVTISASGGTGPYQYSVDNGAFQLSNTFSSLTLGTHKATVRDAAGCLLDANFTIAQVNSTLSGLPSTTNSSCDQPNGAVTISANGGTGPYQFSLDNQAYVSSGSFPGLLKGQHKVTVKDALGCTVAVNFTISQTANVPNLVVNNPPKICPGTTANLQANAITSGSDAGLTYTYWTNPSTTNALSTPNAAGGGTYYIKATNASGCTQVKPVDVILFSVSPGSITAPRLSACVGDSIALTAGIGVSYQWYRDDTLIVGATSSIYQAAKTGSYSATINDGNCAVKTANSVKLQFRECGITESTSFVPTAFTPNKNGQNDVLRPVFYRVSALMYFKVYNRWGQQVFETNIMGKGWDGTINGVPQPSDTYSWILEFVGKNGETGKLSGRSLLIR